MKIDLEAAHKRASHHRAEIFASGVCGCFSCLETFPPSAIAKWTDGGQTALCPRCSIDAVIGSGSGIEINADFLRSMKAHWF